MSFRNDDDFDSESYVKVNTRLMEFWDKNPEGRIETGVVFNGDGALVEARLYRKGETTPCSVGHAYLDRLDGEKVLEYTETVAVGRALALKGHQVEKSIASGEEMRKFKDRQESRKEAAPARESKIKPAAPKQESAPAAETPPAKTEAAPVAQATEQPKAEAKEISDTPQVPKTLKASRIYKPAPKQVSNGGVANG